jgi:serine/threonine protein kinase
VANRDVKPSNIVLHEGPQLAGINASRRAEGRPSLYTAKLCDFGYSKDFNRSDPKSLVSGEGGGPHREGGGRAPAPAARPSWPSCCAPTRLRTEGRCRQGPLLPAAQRAWPLLEGGRGLTGPLPAGVLCRLRRGPVQPGPTWPNLARRVQVGTLEYMAPEYLLLEEHGNKPDGQKLDIWSAGITLFQLLQKEPPFKRCAAGGGCGCCGACMPWPPPCCCAAGPPAPPPPWLPPTPPHPPTHPHHLPGPACPSSPSAHQRPLKGPLLLAAEQRA